jgi:adenylate kinase
LPYLSSGALLRRVAAGEDDLARRVRDHLNHGELVPDELVDAIIGDALADVLAAGGYVLDGYPRTVAQAQHLHDRATLDAAIELALPDDIARRRIASRGDGRGDEDRGVVERRLQVFHREADPLLDFYRRRGLLTTIDADQPPDDVTAAILTALDQ